MQGFREFLNESLTDIVYHVTHVPNAHDIITHNRLLTSVLTKSEAKYAFDIQKTGPKVPTTKSGAMYAYYISVARTPLSSYLQQTHHNALNSSASGGSVTFKLDGRKLGQRYKAEPISYYGSRQDSARLRWDAEESEDRILLNDKYLKNFLDYVLEVHLFDPNPEYSTSLAVQKKNMIEVLQSKGIPIKIYVSQFDREAVRSLRPALRTSKMTLNELIAKYDQVIQSGLENEAQVASPLLMKSPDTLPRMFRYSFNLPKLDEVIFGPLAGQKFKTAFGEIPYNDYYLKHVTAAPNDKSKHWSIQFDNARPLVRVIEDDIDTARMSKDENTQMMIDKIYKLVRKRKQKSLDDYITTLLLKLHEKWLSND